MRILIVAGSFHPEIGGPSRYLHALATDLTRGGHPTRVVTMSPSELPEGDCSEPYPFGVVRISRRHPLPLRLARMARVLAGEARRADVIYVSDYGLPAAVMNLRHHVPMAIKIVGDFAWEYSRRNGLTSEDIDAFQTATHRGRMGLLRSLQRFYTGQARRVIVPSRYLARMVAGWGICSRRIRVIPNAVVPDNYRLPATAAEARALLGRDRRYLVTVARLTPWKGIDALIRALPGLPEDTDLVVVGEGPEREALQREADRLGVQGRVELAGAVAPERVGVYLKGAEALALYSGYEGLSHVLLEGLLAGIPIIASRKGGNAEVIEHGRSGLLVPFGEETELRGALRQVLEDPATRRRLAEGAARRSSCFSWSTLLARTIQTLEEIAA